MRAIAIDDDLMIILMIKKLVGKTKSIEFVGGYDDAIEGAAGIILDQPDLVFLDIDMPTFTGLQILESLVSPPQIIVISSNENYKQSVLDLKAIAFFKKPISQKQFVTFLDNLSASAKSSIA
jgi:two-component SAPR family response regulator